MSSPIDSRPNPASIMYDSVSGISYECTCSIETEKSGKISKKEISCEEYEKILKDIFEDMKNQNTFPMSLVPPIFYRKFSYDSAILEKKPFRIISKNPLKNPE